MEKRILLVFFKNLLVNLCDDYVHIRSRQHFRQSSLRSTICLGDDGPRHVAEGFGYEARIKSGYSDDEIIDYLNVGRVFLFGKLTTKNTMVFINYKLRRLYPQK